MNRNEVRSHRRLETLGRRLLPLFLSAVVTGTASAQSTAQPLLAPPNLRTEEAKKASPSTPEPRPGRERHYTLLVKYTQGKIRNPATGKEDRVELRSYVEEAPGAQASLAGRFIAPTIEMHPGETIRMTLKNQLPSERCLGSQDPNVPACFNTTNLHSHGLWISPSGNSDNVLVNINPGVDFQYEYNVPLDHPAGTFWYHPHKHGSTALQVASGMAGALIIKGTRPPTPERSGDIDTLLKRFEPKASGRGDYPEVLVFQQIPYACFDRDGKIATNEDKTWSCGEGQTGRVEDFKQQFGPNTWATAGRPTLINGQVHPAAVLEAGQVHRFRLVNAGIRESLALRIVKASPGAKKPEKLTPSQEGEFIKGFCPSKPEDQLPQWEIAADGLTRQQILQKRINHLQPGYRSDVLVVFPTEGQYCVYDDVAASASTSITNEPEKARLLAWVTVRGGTPVKGDLQGFLTEQLVAAAADLPEAVQAKVQRELKDGLKTSSFTWHRTVEDDEVRSTRLEKVVFNIDVATKPNRFEINGRPYASDRIDHTLVLGTAQEWSLSSERAAHPFHIHVNPFQVVSIRNKYTQEEVNEGQYAGMKGAWKDTLIVQPDVEVRIRTRYQRYIGDFVLHCHILDHEDQGMMQNVRIVPPDGNGGAAIVGHHH